MTLHKIKNLSKFALIVVMLTASLSAVPAATYAYCTDGHCVNDGSGSTTPATPATTAPSAAGSLDCNGSTTKLGDKSGAYCIPDTPDPALINTDTNSTLITGYLNPAIKLLSVLVAVAVTVGVIYGGIQYSMSAGDPQKAASGRKHVRDAVIALVAYALALGFLNFLIPGGILF